MVLTLVITQSILTAEPEFVFQMNEVAKIANYEAVEIVCPYLDVDKIGILTDGLVMGLDYSETWTCYNGREKACGKCGACQERLEALLKTRYRLLYPTSNL